jgi:hypothetical protein
LIIFTGFDGAPNALFRGAIEGDLEMGGAGLYVFVEGGLDGLGGLLVRKQLPPPPYTCKSMKPAHKKPVSSPPFSVSMAETFPFSMEIA